MLSILRNVDVFSLWRSTLFSRFNSAKDLVFMFKPAYPRGKFQTSNSMVLPALAESYTLNVALYSNHIVRS